MSFTIEPRAWARWWRHEDRALARRQLRRGLRPPWLLLGLYVLMQVLVQLMFLDWPRGSKLFIVSPWFFLLGLLFNGLALASVLVVIDRDCLAYFRGSRLRDLLLTPITARQLFPTLLLAPIATLTLLLAISQLADAFGRYGSGWDLLDPRTLLYLISRLGLHTGIAALTVALTITRPSRLKLAAIGISLHLFVFYIVIQALYILSGNSFESQSALAATMYSAHIILAALAWFFALRRLRSDTLLDRLRVGLELAPDPYGSRR